MERYIAVDNVCAWPNLTRLADGSIVATIFNQPTHGGWEGDVECWASTDFGKGHSPSTLTALGTRTLSDSERKRSSKPSWWRYCMGDVLQMRLGKRRLSAQLVLSHPQRRYAIVGEA